MENGTWSGIIGMVARGEADMGLTYLAIMEDRSKFVDFSTPYYSFGRTLLRTSLVFHLNMQYSCILLVWMFGYYFHFSSNFSIYFQKWISAERPVPFRLPDVVEEFLQLARRNESFQKQSFAIQDLFQLPSSLLYTVLFFCLSY
ncbi:hypothetical protein CEXT_233911 [Caerostris extrusa]|uniref:Ionotropic glutamate receptor L-glutamate and glycine-binding domain-containing protein n=1 Tax=Caerostris extrusa TaxID=172846 RepID=A0AAV4W4F6_CAEEX|nr:hypothetical protein CEXT_233911 [Caerostris extrusa]